MLMVYICEDDNIQRNRISGIIENSIIREKLDMKIALSSPFPGDILSHAAKYEGPCIFFLDIDLKQDMNGFQLSQKLREEKPDCFIVFITTHSEMCFLTFEYMVEAMDYIIKDNPNTMKERISACLVKAIKRNMNSNKEEHMFRIESDETIINVRFDDILFFETSESAHKVKLHEKNRQIEFYAALRDIEEKLDGRFYRCHKAYIVNKDNIREIDKANRVIYMVNGEKCFVSLRYLRGL